EANDEIHESDKDIKEGLAQNPLYGGQAGSVGLDNGSHLIFLRSSQGSQQRGKDDQHQAQRPRAEINSIRKSGIEPKPLLRADKLWRKLTDTALLSEAHVQPLGIVA